MLTENREKIPQEVRNLGGLIKKQGVTTDRLLEFLENHGAFANPVIESYTAGYLHSVSSGVDLKLSRQEIGVRQTRRLKQVAEEDNIGLWGSEDDIAVHSS